MEVVVGVKSREDSKLRYREIRNKKVYRKFHVGERYETGIVLLGTEVKSIRSGRAQIDEAFVRIEKGRAILYHAHIAAYTYGNTQNHRPYRPRELLLHRRQIRRLSRELQSGGTAVIPTKIYFRKALIKVEIAVCSGKKLRDKREDLKKKAEMRELERVRKSRGFPH